MSQVISQLTHITEKETIYIKAAHLQLGMKIINVGVVKRVEEYANATVVYLVTGKLNNAIDRAEFSTHEYVFVDSVEGEAVIVDRYF